MAMFSDFMNEILWGVHVWIWFYLVLSFGLFMFVVIYFYKELIRKKYYEVRFPEKLLKIVVHFKSGYFKEYWRLIPATEEFIIDGKLYKYSDKIVMRDNEFYLRKKNANIVAVIDGRQYDINDKLKLIKRWRSYPELHYFYNIPMPIDFDLSNKALEFSSTQLQEFKENDLFAKLLTLDTERNMLVMVIVIGVINLLISVFIVAKLMGWLDK
jgi:hypothetical protein